MKFGDLAKAAAEVGGLEFANKVLDEMARLAAENTGTPARSDKERGYLLAINDILRFIKRETPGAGQHS